MNNFAFKYNGETLWYSRSVACSMYYFVYNHKDRQWYILISKRGPGCPSAVGQWNVPGGYLDFNETMKEAAVRECFEETGIKVNINDVKLAAISTNLNSKKQNIVCSFFATAEISDIEILKLFLTNSHCEANEVDDICFYPVSYFTTKKSLLRNKAFPVAFGHDKMIVEIFNKRVNIGFIRKFIFKIIEKLTHINIPIE